MAKAKKPKDETPAVAEYSAPVEPSIGERIADFASDMVESVLGHADPKSDEPKAEATTSEAEETSDPYQPDALADHPKFDKFK